MGKPEELGECPECTTEVPVLELDIFGGVCEDCFDTKNEDDDEVVE